MRLLLAMFCVSLYCFQSNVAGVTLPPRTSYSTGSGDGQVSGSGSGDLESGDGSGGTEVTDIPVDLEPGDVDDLEPGSGSLELDNGSGVETGAESSKHAWLQHLRSGLIDLYREKDIADFVAFHQKGASDCYASEAAKETFDGPAFKLPGELEKKADGTLPVFGCNEEIKDIHHSPQFAVGLLDNGCTAFLVGPYHALTLAECVYDIEQKMWREDLDFWRGRNGGLYLQRMEWQSVYIPRNFFNSRQDNELALITFSKARASPVWLSFGHCRKFFLGSEEQVVVYGYNSPDKMVVNHCFAPSESEMHCKCPRGQNRVNDIGFDSTRVSVQGGPILNEMLPKGGRMVPVVGMSHGRYALSFNSNQFWSLCFLLMKSGFEPNCDKVVEF